MRSLYIVVVALSLAGSALGFEVELQREDGSRINPKAAGVELTLTRRPDSNGVETVACRLVSKSDGLKQLRLTAYERFVGATRIWDGRDEKKPPKNRYEHPLYLNYTFLMAAMWKPGAGLALGTGAEDFNSDADAVFEGDMLSVSVHAALLEKGSVYTCTFHRIAFDPKYGIRDALAHYYPLYPQRFARDRRVTQGVYGICSQYASWRNGDPEACRFMNATWEWCHGAGRSWGDMLNEEIPSGKMNVDYSWVEKNTYCLRDGKQRIGINSKMTREEFDRMQNSRLASGYYCGVANGFYTMALANVSNRTALRYRDSTATENPIAANDYFYATEVFTFPECSWGTEVRRQISTLVKKCDLGALAFDVSRPRSVYRGERLKEMSNVSWDRFGPGVVRGVGSARLFEFIRELPNKRLSGNTAVAVNTKYQHLSDLLYIDMTMFEMTPWDRDPPFPMAGRYALGEKGLTLWEGYSPREFDPNFDKWPPHEKGMLINDLAHYAIHRSFASGASLPCAFQCGYVARMSHAFVRMNEAGWKPVIGAEPEGPGWELARYGAGDRSYLAICNESNAVRTVDLRLYPGELATGVVGGRSAAGFVFAPFFGGTAVQRIGGGTERVSADVGAMLVNVLEAVGEAEGEGRLSASWSGEPGRAVLTLVSQGFKGKVRCREAFENYRLEGAREIAFAGGEKVVLSYLDGDLLKIAEAVRRLDLSNLRKVLVEHAADMDSKDMADRIAAFFRGVTRPRDSKKAKKHVSPVKVAETAALGPLVVRMGGLTISAVDREALSVLVRRTLNVLNAIRYPEYGPQPVMEPFDSRHFPCVRW